MRLALTIDSAGRIVLPAELRRRLNLVPGSRLLLDVVAQRIELTPEPPPAPELVRSAGQRAVLPASGQPLDAAALTRAERDDRTGRGA